MCATCFAINKKSSTLLNEKKSVRDNINKILEECKLEPHKKGSIDPQNNIFHIVDILYKKKEEISKKIKLDLSNMKIATHHACHYCKVSNNNILEESKNSRILDKILESCNIHTIGASDEKRKICGTGVRQRFINKELSLKVTAMKLLELKEKNVDILIHMCPNCHMQFIRYQPYLSKKLKIDLNIIN